VKRLCHVFFGDIISRKNISKKMRHNIFTWFLSGSRLEKFEFFFQKFTIGWRKKVTAFKKKHYYKISSRTDLIEVLSLGTNSDISSIKTG
jgi:hypothetical protein